MRTGRPRPPRWPRTTPGSSRSGARPSRSESRSGPMTPPNVVILAAGLGSRLAKPFPKPLTPLHGAGTSIMQQQVEHLQTVFPGVTPCVVIGFKKDLIMESFPNSLYIYNEDYADTNTSKSL